MKCAGDLRVYPVWNHETLEFKCGGRTIRVRQTLFGTGGGETSPPPPPPIHGVVWASAAVAIRLLEHVLPVVRGATVLELGSGLGLFGIASGVLGAKRVCLTDLAPALPRLRSHIKSNRPALGSVDVSAERLRWGTGDAKALRAAIRPNLILASDCIYNKEVWPLLRQSLAILADKDTTILSVEQIRPGVLPWFDRIKADFDVVRADAAPVLLGLRCGGRTPAETDKTEASRAEKTLKWLCKRHNVVMFVLRKRMSKDCEGGDGAQRKPSVNK